LAWLLKVEIPRLVEKGPAVHEGGGQMNK